MTCWDGYKDEYGGCGREESDEMDGHTVEG